MRNFGIPNLMNYVVGGMVVVFLLDLLAPGVGVSYYLFLDMGLVGQGQLWRLVSFIFLPTTSSPLWMIFSAYFYWTIGSALERQWGTARFTLYYLVGILGSILAACLTGYATNDFLNLSMFFAFAALYPDFELMLFFFLPVKIKYLALLDAALYTWQLIVGSWSTRAAILFSLLNLILFVGGDLVTTLRRESAYWKTRRNFRKSMRK